MIFSEERLKLDSIAQKFTYRKPCGWHLGMSDKICYASIGCLYQNTWQSFDDEALRKLMVEVEGVVNSRALTVDTIRDADSQISIYFTKQYIDYEIKCGDASTWKF